LNVLTGDARVPRNLRAFASTPRLRPGEVPLWVDTGVPPHVGRQWRERAHARGIGVDAWLTVVTEFALATHTPGRSHLDGVPGLYDTVRVETADRRLAPSEALRRWVRVVSGASDAVAGDELPTVVMPERVVEQVPADSLSSTIRRAAAIADDALPLACERLAAARGLTLGAWLALYLEGGYMAR
jgi:hypothetical protein